MFQTKNTIKRRLFILSLIPLLITSSIVIGIMLYNNNILRSQKEILDNLYFYQNLLLSFSAIDDDLDDLISRAGDIQGMDLSLAQVEELGTELQSFVDAALPTSSWSMIKGLSSMLETYMTNTENIFLLIENRDSYYNELKYNRDVSNFIRTRIDLIVSIYLHESSDLYLKISDLNEKIQLLLVLICPILIGILLLFIVKFSQSISDPIISLARNAEKVAGGEMEVTPVRITSNDEIAVLSNSFNEMVGKIRVLITELINQSELERKLKDEEMRNLNNVNFIREAEIKMLRSQINPHFLFNTLNTISKMALIEEALTTHTLIQSTAQLLRYNLENERKEILSLRDEINNIREYITIYKTRFPEKFDYTFCIETQSLDIQVPFLILQPLVENAIIHGIEPLAEKGTLIIHVFETIFQDEHCIAIEIIDDGIGMSRETINHILLDESAGLGIHNVKKRIEYFFGRKDLLDLGESESGDTMVRIFIPAIT
jgi:two-component system, sensor histidine kinase YesM